MTAATWVRPTHRNHRFRLYFSDAVRDHTPRDHVVWWGNPDQTALTPEHGNAWEYQRFLADETRQSATRLSGLTNPHGFKLDDLREMLADLGITDPEPEAEDEVRPTGASQPGQRTAATEEHQEDDSGEVALRACAAHVKAPNLAQLAADVRRLQRLAKSDSLTDRQRARYRDLIASHGLLKRNPSLGEHEGALYDALLTLAFGKPLSYQAYCHVEDCLGNPPSRPPHRRLLQAIERLGTDDVRVTAIVLTHLRDKQRPHQQISSSLFDVVQLIHLLSQVWERSQHFRIVLEVTLEYLANGGDRNDQAAVRRALRQHGFLAQAMRNSGCGDQYQVHILYRLLAAVYPDGLSRTAITAVLRVHPASPVTPALFAAVLMLLARPQDAQLARDAYSVASLTALSLDPETSKRIAQLVPTLDQTSGGFVSVRSDQLSTARGRSTTNDDVPGPGL